MPLVIEDGTGVLGANSYNTEAQFLAYFAEIGVDVTALTTAQIESGLIDAATNMLEYCFTYKGEISYPLTPQPLLWPRTGLCDRRGLDVASDSLPVELLKAQNELARSIAVFSGRMAFSDTPDNTGAVKKSKLDVMEEEYFGPGTSLQLTISQTVRDYVGKLLAPYIRGGSNFQVTNVAVV